MTSPQDRFKVIDQPIVAPGKCAGCGVAHGDVNRKFIDVGLDLDWYGVLYFCTMCFCEIANSLEYTSPGQSEKMKQANDQLFEMNQELVQENEHLRSSVNTLSSHVCRGSDGAIRNSSEPSRGKEVPPPKTSSGGKQDAKNVKHDVGKGSPTIGRTESDSDSLEVLRI